MQQIAPIVKSSIEHFCATDDQQMFMKEQEQLDVSLDKLYQHFNDTVSHLTQDEVDHMYIDYAERYQTCCNTFPKTSLEEMFGAYSDRRHHLDEVFSNEKEFRMEFSKIKNTLVNTFGMYEPYVELYDPFGHGTLAFIKQPIDDRLSDRVIISTIVPVINRNISFLTEFMDANGYYLIRCAFGDDVVHYSSDGRTALMANMCFARKQPVDISKIIASALYLYHVTPESKVSHIMNSGLVPKSRMSAYSILNTDIHYPARTYFFCGGADEEAISYAKKDMPPGRYHLLRVNTSDLSPELPIYPDPLLSGSAIYLEFVIPTRYITDVCTFTVN